MNLFPEFEDDYTKLMRGVRLIPAPVHPLQFALDDLNEIESQARRMIADAPPYDGHDRRGK